MARFLIRVSGNQLPWYLGILMALPTLGLLILWWLSFRLTLSYAHRSPALAADITTPPPDASK
jgi:hypothetical protein